MEALISLPADYPKGYPLFALRLLPKSGSSGGGGSDANGGNVAQTHLNNDGIRDIERELNLYPDDLVEKAGELSNETILSNLG